MSTEHTPLQMLWGNQILDKGFTTIPNLILRNYRKLGIEHGEYGFLSILISFRYGEDYITVTQKEIASIMCMKDTRQIEKWVASLVKKGLLRVGMIRNERTKQRESNVYDLSPLVNAALRIVGREPMADHSPKNVEWYSDSVDDPVDNPPVPEVREAPTGGTGGSAPEVRVGQAPGTGGSALQVRDNILITKAKESSNQELDQKIDEEDYIIGATLIDTLHSKFRDENEGGRFTDQQWEFMALLERSNVSIAMGIAMYKQLGYTLNHYYIRAMENAFDLLDTHMATIQHVPSWFAMTLFNEQAKEEHRIGTKHKPPGE